MSYLIFELSGEMAMWRNPYESMGSFSALGPAPSNIAGLLGAAMGFAAPRSQAAEDTPDKDSMLKKMDKGGLPWPLSNELLEWEKSTDLHVACRWNGGYPHRIPWNLNGCKDVALKEGNIRMQQQVIVNPMYEVAVKAPESELKRLESALKQPAFPLYLGASFCKAIIKNVRIEKVLPDNGNWAFGVEKFAIGESVPLSRHVTNPEQCFERIQADGYWVYPTDVSTAKKLDDPFVRTYCTVEEK